MRNELLRVALRKNAVFIDQDLIKTKRHDHLNATTTILLANCKRLGYTFSEDLLVCVNSISPKLQLDILDLLKDVTGVQKNWTPLVKQWNIPTGESILDHIVTFFSNVLKSKKGTKLACGHVIPDGTFPLERYNGCPFCGSQFEFETLDYEVGQNKLKVLSVWTENDLKSYLVDLLQSPTALDANQVDDLKILINVFEKPVDVHISMKETLMIVIDALVEKDKDEIAGRFFTNPNDILRYLWYKKTGFLQLVEPKTIINRLAKNAKNLHNGLDKSEQVKISSSTDLKLKYSRAECRRYAKWMNELKMNVYDQCENMHPKRSMWVRVIRALRLAEYSKKKGYENLAQVLDVFYNQTYDVWQGHVNQYRLKADADATFSLLKQRPGLFARSLFSNMLWFGPDAAIDNFKEVMNQVPARLIYTLNMYADLYFDPTATRTVKPLGGVNKKIPKNSLLELYSKKELNRMKSLVQDLSLDIIQEKFRNEKNANKTMYIADQLYSIPIAIGDRVEHLQDGPGALMGTRFKVNGDKVRLFLNWGQGLPAQHLDMDLSCSVAYENRQDFCSYSRLVIPGCKHSGDIQRIPNHVGTAEYIDIDLNELSRRDAKYVAFTCNAYTNGSLSPNLVVGWMNSLYPMKISRHGVAYDPTAVQHQVRIKQSLTKGMVFGVLDVEKREIVWMEMGFGGQIAQRMSMSTVKSLLNKLEAKLKIGILLQLKAQTQGLELISDPDIADECYDMEWALNTAEVSNFFLA